jgi:hypothetical protein
MENDTFKKNARVVMMNNVKIEKKTDLWRFFGGFFGGFSMENRCKIKILTYWTKKNGPKRGFLIRKRDYLTRLMDPKKNRVKTSSFLVFSGSKTDFFDQKPRFFILKMII